MEGLQARSRATGPPCPSSSPAPYSLPPTPPPLALLQVLISPPTRLSPNPPQRKQNNLTRQGWRRTSLRPGEKISVRVAPLRNGHPGGLFLDLKKTDGTILDSGLPKDGTAVNVPRI